MARDGRRFGIDKWHTRVLQRQLRSKVKKFTTRNTRKVCQLPRCVHFSANIDIYESLASVSVELKRQNSQANRSITFYKDSDTSLAKPGKIIL